MAGNKKGGPALNSKRCPHCRGSHSSDKQVAECKKRMCRVKSGKGKKK